MSVAEKVLQLKQDFDDVYEAGQKEVWKFITDEGTRTDYGNAFLKTNLEYFEPKYDISPTSATYMFANSIGSVDLADKFEKNGVSLDFSSCTNFTRAFYNSKITKLGVIDCASAKALDYTFGLMTGLQTIEKWIVDSNNTFSNTFSTASALENIIVEGVIANDISFSSCKKLTHDSLMSIINALDTLESGVTQTLTLGSTNLAKLTDAEKAVATQKGWTLA